MAKINNTKTTEMSMTWHKILRFVKVLFGMSAVTNAFMVFQTSITTNSIIELLFQIVMFIAVSISFFYHDYNKGVIAFMAYGVIELMHLYLSGYNSYLLAQSGIGELMLSYTFGSLILFVPTWIYYQKRKAILK